MSFRKRNVALGKPDLSPAPPVGDAFPSLPSGVRPSPIDGRPTTSTGTQTLDELLGGHAGLPLGNSMLIEENGTTDFAGALLRFYAAEGIVHGHQVHVVGMGEDWSRDLPGLTGLSAKDRSGERTGLAKERMKIAWRYERLGEFGTGKDNLRTSPAPNRTPPTASQPTKSPSSTDPPDPTPFTHTFDLTKRLQHPPTSPPINFIPIPSPLSSESPYNPILSSLAKSLANTPPNTPHRVIIPTLLSPALYPPTTSPNPTALLPFLHSLRALLHDPQNCTRLSAFITLPLSLHPRSQGLTRWIELLADGVIELTPFPHSIDLSDARPVTPFTTSSSSSGDGSGKSTTTSSSRAAEEAKAQGLLKVRKLPDVTEKGCGLASATVGGGDDLAFVLTRRRFVIKPFYLPPVEGEEQGGGGGEGSGEGKGGLEF